MFNSTSKDLPDKHFRKISLINDLKGQAESTLLDDSFGELTFDGFYAYGVKRIGNQAFGKAAETIKYLSCEICSIVCKV